MFFILFSASFALYSLLRIHWQGSKPILSPLAEREAQGGLFPGSCLSQKPLSLPAFCTGQQGRSHSSHSQGSTQTPPRQGLPDQDRRPGTPGHSTARGRVLVTHQQHLAKSTRLLTGISAVFRYWLCKPSNSKKTF